MLTRMQQNKNPYTLMVRIQISTTTVESSMEIHQKAKDRTAYHPVIPLLGIYPEKCKTEYNRDTCTPMFIAALFTIAKLWKQSK
jgi:hypothetical protein